MKRTIISTALLLSSILAFAGPRLDSSDYHHHGGGGGGIIAVIALIVVGIMFMSGGRKNE